MQMNLEPQFEVTTFCEPEAALRSFRTNIPGAVLLDIHFDGKTDGLTIFDQIKALRPDLPVFFLSCNTAAEMIGQGLLKGGVDYFTKTMTPAEIVTRLRARMETLRLSTILRCRDIELHMGSREVRVKGKLVSFTPKGYDILRVFMERQDQMLSKHELKDILWKDVHVDVNNIDTHMFHIRKKFGARTEGIECRKGVGYILHSRKPT